MCLQLHICIYVNFFRIYILLNVDQSTLAKVCEIILDRKPILALCTYPALMRATRASCLDRHSNGKSRREILSTFAFC